jgi:biopolymer transport protein ExbB
MNSILLQITSKGAEEVAEIAGSSIFEIISGIGITGLVIMTIIFLLSVYSIYIFVERYFTIKKAGVLKTDFMDRVKEFVSNGNIEGAKDWCRKEDTPIAHLIGKGVSRIGKSMKDISATIENQGNLEIQKMEKGLVALATISGAAPMLGFLGTVTGMITTFKDIADGNTAANEMAGGLYEAMFTTAFGLAAGLIAYVAYNVLTGMIDKVIYKIEDSSVEFIDLLSEPSK